MELNIPGVLKAVLEDYALPLGGHHGVAHWARVLENGLRLAEQTGASVEVVQLFAVLHDSRRLNESTYQEVCCSVLINSTCNLVACGIP